MASRIYLVNSEAQIVRQISFTGEKLVVAKNTDTNRLEFLAASTYNKLTAAEKSAFDVLEKVSILDLDKKDLKIGSLKLVSQKNITQSLSFVKSENYREDDQSLIKATLKRSAISHIVAVALILITAFVYSNYIKENKEEVIVTNVKILKPEKKVTKTFKVAKKKKTSKRKKYGKKKKNVKYAKRSRNKKRIGKVGNPNAKNIRKMGVLGSLSGIHAGSRKNVKVGAINGNVKYGRTGKRGGSMRSVVGKGLVASGYGKGEVVGGAGRYAKRGKGGGGNGYGRHSLTGGKYGFLQSLPQETTITGGLAQEQIDSVIRRNQGQMIYCYEKGLLKNKKLSGRVSLSFTINPKGRVKVANVKNSNLRSRTVESCVVSKLKKFKFPRPEGRVNVKVTYPFVFQMAGRG